MFSESYEENEFRAKLKELFKIKNYRHINEGVLDVVVSSQDQRNSMSFMMFMDYLIDREKNESSYEKRT